MSARPLRAALFALALLCAAPAAFGAEPAKTGTLTYLLENDLFYDTDRGYTNGAALIWVPSAPRAPDWAVRVAHWLPWIPRQSEVRHGYILGQNMYTSSDITVVDPPAGERPYAGWLYGTLGLVVETDRQLDQLALTLGVVGPASQAEQTQKIIHDITGSKEPRGWDTQLDNEPGIVLTYQRSWRGLGTTTLLRNDLDLTPHLGGALGNVYTYANAGFTLRYGPRLPLDYGPPRIQPSVPGSGFFAPTDKLSWYLFVGAEGRAVARDIFLDGNTFQDSRSVDKNALVAELQWGVVVTWRGMRLSYTHVARSQEFETQAERAQFGAVSLSVAF